MPMVRFTAMTRPNPDCEEIISCDLEFHSSFYAATKNDLIIAQGEMINKVTRYTREKNMQKIIEEGALEQSLEVHRNLMEVVTNRDRSNLHEALTACFSEWHKKLLENNQ